MIKQLREYRAIPVSWLLLLSTFQIEMEVEHGCVRRRETVSKDQLSDGR